MLPKINGNGKVYEANSLLLRERRFRARSDNGEREEMLMKHKFKLTALLLAFAMLFMPLAVPCQAESKTTGMNVKYHSQKEIRKFLKKNSFNTGKKLAYKRKPSVKPSSYRAGELKKSSQKNGLNALNVMRYVAGIPANVKIDNTYSRKSQAAALVNAANNILSHSPSKPSKMSDSLYALGLQGASSSNLAMRGATPGYGAVNLGDSILSWMEDSDAYNIDRVGHRRWILNPAMKKTGFGAVEFTQGYFYTYSAMYAFDNAFGNTKYYGVAWPAQNMPMQYFDNGTAWSISMNKNVNAPKVKVTLTRKKDGKKWTFSQKKAKGYFNVENSNYGQTGCIIFRPDNIKYQAGDTFQVKITGLDQTVSYQVKFFNL